MIHPDSMQVFLTVVETGNFSLAARRLDMATSSVSRHIQQLEEALEVQLFTRTTRSMTMTDAGRIFETHAGKILADIQGMHAVLHDRDTTPTGTLRISATVVLGRMHVAPAILDYMAAWPEVDVELDLTDRLVDLVDQGIDVGIRVGQLPDSTLVARRLAPLTRLVCASPAYLEKFGRPKTPAALKKHNCITFHLNETSPLWRASGQLWRFKNNRGLQETTVSGDLKVNSADVLIQAALADRGLILVVDWVAQEHIDNGSLVPVLTNYTAAPAEGHAGVFAVYPSGRHAPAKVRTFVDHIQNYFDGKYLKVKISN